MGVMLSNISREPVGIPGKADEIIKQASFGTFVSFFTRYFSLRPPAQDTHAYDMIERIIAVYILFHHRWFYSPRFTHNLSILH